MRFAAQVILVFLAADLVAFGGLLAVVWLAYRRRPAGDDTPSDSASFVAVGLGWAAALLAVGLSLWALS